MSGCCVKYSVAGTFVGRLDGAKDVGLLLRDAGGKVMGIGGFGKFETVYNCATCFAVRGGEISPPRD